MIKFVLLGHKRCGSTLLYASLTCHGNVYMFGEVFNESVEERQKAFLDGINGCRVASYLSITGQDYYHSGDAARFLDRSIYFNRYWRPVAVGFKLFYEHCREDALAMRAWDYLAENKEIRVIHLKRLNLLETFLSLTIALRTNEWARFKGADPGTLPQLPDPIYIPPRVCEDYFLEITRERQAMMERFSEHQVLELTYESDICLRYQKTFDSICDFLMVPRIQTQMLFEKQATGKPSQRISNYAELKSYFADTEFSDAFE